ncbi:hypothetical protein BT69DRAFT_1295114 [Atractiella rhizophila]|nr:hypothetical protein BT69DRAFT_1295114 [Atractiella rhizophila]
MRRLEAVEEETQHFAYFPEIDMLRKQIFYNRLPLPIRIRLNAMLDPNFDLTFPDVFTDEQQAQKMPDLDAIKNGDLDTRYKLPELDDDTESIDLEEESEGDVQEFAEEDHAGHCNTGRTRWSWREQAAENDRRLVSARLRRLQAEEQDKEVHWDYDIDDEDDGDFVMDEDEDMDLDDVGKVDTGEL